nr:immunoglobulin light chain junction region [Macaca mulatta]MOW41817.1 immunoglobulin light chain junction region [Macaca mulatta]MOW42787.1 immunoglobulin light chain junction region [Macaca mulatta]MOW42984.1 immunoglobulin light chain junction region [Macaca mulatta]MOW43311.1 immunoglobulin light chain junction region [Macaca mulatta]
CFQGTHLPFTF